MLVVQLIHHNEPEFEFSIMRQLLEFEIERCPRCRQVHTETEHLPQHCIHCSTVRDERWYFQLNQRAQAIARSGFTSELVRTETAPI